MLDDDVDGKLGRSSADEEEKNTDATVFRIVDNNDSKQVASNIAGTASMSVPLINKTISKHRNQQQIENSSKREEYENDDIVPDLPANTAAHTQADNVI